MNYLKNNKEFLKGYRTDLLELVRNYEKNNRYAKNIEWDENACEIRVKQGKKNIYLHSIYNKTREIEQLIKNKPKQIEQLCLFGLPDNKQLITIARYFEKLKRIFIVIPSIGLFYKWLQYNNLSEYLTEFTNTVNSEELVLVVADEFEQVESTIITLTNVGQHEKIVVLPFVSYLTLFTEFFLKICQCTKIALTDKNIMDVTRKFWRNTWLIHNWSVLKAKTANLLHLKELFARNTCIVVAAGASLEKNISLLQEARDKAIIIAAGTAISVLAKHGIKPHFHMAVDGSDLANRIFANTKDLDIPLICSYSVYSPLLREYKGSIFTFAIDAMDKIAIAAYKYFSEDLLISTGGLSVVNIAHAIAVQMGCKKVVMVGQDCCFYGNKVHAKGSWSEGSRHNQSDNSILLQDINGKTVYSSDVFIGMKRAIERFIETAPNCKFINATEGGLPIIGARNMTLRQVIDKELKNKTDIESTIKEISEKSLGLIARKQELAKQYAAGYKKDMLLLQKLLLEQKTILLQINHCDEGNKNYEIISKAINVFKELDQNAIFLEMMKENFVFDINEALLLDLGEYKYELWEGLYLVNKRLLEYVNAAVVLAEEYLQERPEINRVIFVRQ
ncbi:motility associated factor glycosyltransferase family protein [Succinispira mobilis]|uniref:motility associated factor glycosyltransferase family protein n=1 Tax=Succinispira mobilis TaxID=78120 RepID=UPI00035DAD5A|nr:6-hydroxymethylpterin diphosphokinase MptE-like protein [Succinispira mobilis]